MSTVERRESESSRKWKQTRRDFREQLHRRLWGGGQPWTFRRRRVASLLIVAIALIVTAWTSQSLHAALMRSSVMTGWTLLVCVLMLFAIGIRRRIPILPLGTMSTWTQVHIFTGLFAAGVFLLHVPSIASGQLIADGWLEGTLSFLFLAVSASGLYGLIASRRLPARLTAMGSQPRYDQIAWHREQLAARASERLDSLTSLESQTVLGEFDDQYLRRYMESPLSWSHRLFAHSFRRRRLVIGLNELHRYLEDDGKEVANELSGLVRLRDELDTQHALQWRLRAWVAVHAVMSIALVALAIMHTIHALQFVES
ncbi:hypothetical protein LOC71_02065 [Rhodopirellula sp. JC740]|uniref:Transmembrane protein n=1 Tax=Rhodopirellula halodulae TaxID=2894198 RepID=A0ABS8NBW3_9BACT|nr:hypothetical protein [Rhodopirellula sp. JC740]MCC9641042.1 hypothetical protein [Rhodopirellula sp. JC740]